MQIYNSKQLGIFIRNLRKQMGLKQPDLALTSGTGLRFIVDLEKGKPTCQLEKVMVVLRTLGVKMDLLSPLPDQEI